MSRRAFLGTLLGTLILCICSCAQRIAPPVQDTVEADKDTSWVTVPNKARYGSWKLKNGQYIQDRMVKQYRILK